MRLHLSLLKKEKARLEGRVKQLEGILPICANCKKIRGDQGDWNQIEVYVREHSQAEFSHGICPECVKELYPEEAAEILGDGGGDK